MKIGTRFRRNGVAYEVLSINSRSMRVRDLSTGIIQQLDNLEAKRDRKRKLAEAVRERLRMEVELLTEAVPALRRLRDDLNQQLRNTTPAEPD